MTKIITATVVAAALTTFALSGPASAKPGNGGSQHHHWHGGSVFVVGGEYEPDCYMVKKYSPSGRPYLVEVCG